MVIQQPSTRLKQECSYQLHARIGGAALPSANVFRAGVSRIHAWIKDKFSEYCDEIPKKMCSFECRSAIYMIATIYDEDSGFFSMRTHRPDPDLGGRSWITEAEISAQEDGVYLAVRNSYEVLAQQFTEIQSIPPAFVGKIASALGLYENDFQLGRITKVETVDGVDRLLAFVEDEFRFFPILIVTESGLNPNTVEGKYLSGYLIDAERAARELAFHCHVVKITSDMTYLWTSKAGRNWTVYGGAIRTYYSGADTKGDAFFQHPLILPEKIMKSFAVDKSGNEFTDKVAARMTLVARCKENNMNRNPAWELWGTSFYDKARRDRGLREIERARKEAASQAESVQAQIKRLNDENTFFQKVAESYAKENDQLHSTISEKDNDFKVMGDENDLLSRQIFNLLAQLDAIRTHIRSSTGNDSEDTVPIPDSYEDMVVWVEKHLAGRVELAPRAIRALDFAQFMDIQLVYQALLLLGNEYRDMRLGNITKQVFDDHCAALYLDNSVAVNDIQAGVQEGEYDVQWRRRSRRMNMHIGRGGGGKDDRRCLRIYYLWDDDSQMVVVGHLPSHLDTRST